MVFLFSWCGGKCWSTRLVALRWACISSLHPVWFSLSSFEFTLHHSFLALFVPSLAHIIHFTHSSPSCIPPLWVLFLPFLNFLQSCSSSSLKLSISCGLSGRLTFVMAERQARLHGVTLICWGCSYIQAEINVPSPAFISQASPSLLTRVHWPFKHSPFLLSTRTLLTQPDRVFQEFFFLREIQLSALEICLFTQIDKYFGGVFDQSFQMVGLSTCLFCSRNFKKLKICALNYFLDKCQRMNAVCVQVQ